MTAALPLFAWRGCANAWECDEMGHMNVRFYVARWGEAMAALTAAAALPHAFRADAKSTLLPLDQHVRFHAEARAGAPLTMRAGVLAVGESDARLVHELAHADGRPAATFVTRVSHVDARHGAAFPWAQRTRERLEALTCKLPAAAAPRSIDLARAPARIDAAAAEALGLAVIGRGMATTAEADAFGRVRPDFFIGRISDSVPNLLSAWREEAAHAAGALDGKARRAGAAVVEFRLIYRAWPRPGDAFEVRSGVAEVADKTQRLVHWVLDPATGAAWFSGEAVALTFDLTTRKTIVPTPESRAALAARAIPDLAP